MYGCAYYGETYFGGSCEPYIVVLPLQGRLGCGVYDVYVLTRGGGEIVADFPWTSINWSRILDETSEATILAASFNEGCRAELAVIRPWKHELAIFRDGDLIWVGPVTLPSAPPDQFQVQARDLTAWFDHRLIHEDHVYVDPTDLATIFQDVATDAMAPDNSPGLVIETSPCGVTGTMTLLAVQHLMAGTKIRDLTTTGVDWTAIGRNVLAGGAVVPTASIGTFLDEHFAVPPTPRIDGTAQANAWLVRGSGGGAAGDTVFGYATDPSAATEDGLLESVETNTTIGDNTSAQAAAQSRVALTSDVGTLDNCILSPEAPFTLDELVPGALCDLALEQTSIPIFGQYRLQKVSGAAQSAVGGDDERIVVTFQPVGTT